MGIKERKTLGLNSSLPAWVPRGDTGVVFQEGNPFAKGKLKWKIIIKSICVECEKCNDSK